MVDKEPEIYPLQFKENGMKRVEGKVAEKGIESRLGVGRLTASSNS